MANRLWTSFISLVRRLFLGDPRFRYAPSSIAKVLNRRFESKTHSAYLLPGAVLGRLIFPGRRSLIFYPVADGKIAETQELSISDLFEKCHQEFVLEFLLKSKSYDYLIFPLAMQKRQHWVTLVYDLKNKSILLIDSSTSLTSSYDNQSQLLSELREVFSRYDLSIDSFHYVFQGFQKDNVHCGAWTLANIIAIDSFGLNKYVEKIETFYHDYIDPSSILTHKPEEKEQAIEDDYVFVEYEDMEERFEEVSPLKTDECIQEEIFSITPETLMPSTETIEQWEKEILTELALQIQNKRLTMMALIRRDNVQYLQLSLRKVPFEQLNLDELVEDLESKQTKYKIKDPHRQRQRFNVLGYNDWINKQSIATQVIFEALLYDACSFEPMMQYLYSKCDWLNQFSLLEVYLDRIKVIENHISLKVIDFLVQAEQDNRCAWIKDKTHVTDVELLDWFPKLLVLKADIFIGSKLLLKMVDDITQRFDELGHKRIGIAI